MAIDFPASPVTNDLYTVGSRTWRWNGSAWDFASIGSGSTTIEVEPTAEEVFSGATGALGAVDATIDKLVFWDDSAGKLTYLTLGTNLTITGATLDATGGSSGAVDVIETMLFA